MSLQITKNRQKPSTQGQGKPKRLFLIDGSALAYRSYFAFIRNPLINSKGMNTSGIFGFTGALIRILKEEKPDYLACIFDMRAPTFRHAMYPAYKATREKMPEEMAEQLPKIREVVEAFNLPILEMEGYEADDLMATLAKRAEAEGIETVLVSGDKDLMQLVSDRIRMYLPGRGTEGGELLDPEGVKQKMGVPPESIPDLLALMGDTSDNIPGVPGIGPKTAVELLSMYGDFDSVIAYADRIEKKAIREKLMAHLDQARLSKELVGLKTDAPLRVSISELTVRPPDRERLILLFKELEFNQYLAMLPELVAADRPDPGRHYRMIDSHEKLGGLLKTLDSVPMCAVDLETTSLSPIDAEIVGLSFSWAEGEAAYVPLVLFTRSGDLFSQDIPNPALEALKKPLEKADLHKCGQNIKYDMLVLKRHGIRLQGVDFDTMVAAYLINPTARQYNLDALSLEYLNLKKIKTKELIGSGSKQITMDRVAVERVSEYACEDADAVFRLRKVLEPLLSSSETERLFYEVEMPLVTVLMEMEEAGVKLDATFLAEMAQEMDRQLAAIQEEIYRLAGERFNINSTQQLGQILFEKVRVHELLGLKRPKRTKTGYATDVRVLEGLAAHPLPRRLLDYRQLAKLKSTYVDALPKLIHPKTGRVHASFNQTMTATGRLSSSNPNLQNIPVRTELGREIRKAFISGFPQGKILSADYNQIELRIMAHLSGDETLIASFRHEEDVHRRTAAEIFNIPPEEVTDEQRRQAKTINFGIMYGMGVFGLASRLGISNEEAQRFITAYFARYPRVNEYIARTIREAYEKGYVTTLLNRRRYLPELKSENRSLREFAERTAVNTPIQGTAADLIKVAMIRIAERLRNESWRAKMILQVHDELVFDVPPEEAKALAAMVRSEMEGAIQLDVPIRVDVGIGENWLEAH